MDRVKVWGAVAVTVLTAVITVWWLIAVFQRIDVEPVVNAGAVILDQYSRAKDILLVVLPLFSASVAYWVGTEGTSQARKEARAAKAQLAAVLDVSPTPLLNKAKHEHPGAFPDSQP